jgi:hypothetical protein
MLKRFILWDFPRATWQYDVMVGIILAFIFLTPRDWFRDQPRIPNAGKIAMVPAERGSTIFWVDSQFLASIPEPQRLPRLSEQLRLRTGDKHLTVTRIEPIRDSEDEIQGYMAFVRP